MEWFKKNLLYFILVIALSATLDSLFFSEVLHYPPCVLCWYQRIAMYPLVPLLVVGILRKDRLVHLYAWPLLLVGWAIGIYHNLLYWKILPEAAAPCISGVSCTTKFIEWFGFVTIPFLSWLAFTTMLILLVIYTYHLKKDSNANRS